MRKWVIALLVVIAFGGALGIYYLSRPEQTELATAECDVEIGYSRLRISLPIFVAQEKGYFRDAGIHACLRQYDTAQPLMQALVEGRLNAGGYTALPITYNGMIRANRRLRFVTAMMEDQRHRISFLLVPTNSDIRSVSDLRGKRIGILPTIAYQKWLEAVLERAGVPLSTVVIQQIEPTLQVQALQRGGVDALFTNDPAATSAIQLGVARQLSDEVEVPAVFGEPFIFGSFNVTDEWARNNPDTFNSLVVALDRAVTFINENPAAARDAMRGYLPERFRPHIQHYPAPLYLPTSQVTTAMFERMSSQYRERGIIPRDVSLNGLVVTRERAPPQ